MSASPPNISAIFSYPVAVNVYDVLMEQIMKMEGGPKPSCI